MSVADPTHAQEAASEIEVKNELELILSSRSFRNSQQCSLLLRYVVEHTLNRAPNLLRERVIGCEVFRRAADYEPGDDPVVRLRASEVRKRLAQYYQAEGTNSALRIHVPPGSYRATFTHLSSDSTMSRSHVIFPESGLPQLLPAPAELLPVEGLLAVDSLPTRPGELTPAPARSGIYLLAALFAGCILLLLYAIAAWEGHNHREVSALEAFWAPLTATKVPITLCIADYTPEELTASDWAGRTAAVITGQSTSSRTKAESASSLPLVPFIDSVAVNDVAYWLGHSHSSFETQRMSQLTIDDLRRRPAVLVGAFDNDWTLVLLSKLRFHVAVNPKSLVEWVEDAKDPGDLKWKSPGNLPYTASSVDYAIVTRVLLPETGQWVIGIEGLEMHGTEAAADLLTEERLSYLLPAEARARDKNLQIVLKTVVINGHNSLPQVVATEVW